MRDLRMLVAALLTYLTTSSAALLSTTPSSTPTTLSTRSPYIYGSTSISVPPTTVTPRAELRKREDSTVQSLCGSSEAGDYTFYCPSSVACVATILGVDSAYVLCSTPGLAEQGYQTTAYASFDSNSKCPKNAACCSDKSSKEVMTNLFIASGYTVTNFFCQATGGTQRWNPYTNLLNPTKFAVSLAKATEATTTLASSNSRKAVEPTAEPKEDGGSGDSSDSDDNAVAIGAGVGGGIGVVVIAGIIFFCWRRNQKKKQRELAEVSPSSMPVNSPSMSHGSTVTQQVKVKEGIHQHDSYHSLGHYAGQTPIQHYSELPDNGRFRNQPYELYGQSHESRM